MAKKKESPEATPTENKVEEKKEPQAVAASEQQEKPQPKKEDPKPVKPAGPAVPFARWFSAKGFKPHWRGGMEAYADTSGRKTVEEWDTIFKNY